MQNQSNSITLLVGRIDQFQQLVVTDRQQALHILQGYQEPIELGIAHYQGHLNTSYQGEGCLLEFRSIQNAMDCAFYINNQYLDQEIAIPLLVSPKSVKEGIDLNELPKQIMIHSDLRKELKKFAGPKIILSEPIDDKHPYSTLNPASQTKRRRLGILYGAVAAAIILFLFILIPHLKSDGVVVNSKMQKSIAVLPFVDRSKVVDSFFADGVIDDIRAHLSKFEGLKVISRTSSNQFRASFKNTSQIATELNVQYLLEGSVRQWDNQIKIAVQLIDALNDEQLWGETYERELKDVFAIQSEVSKNIANSLSQNISPEISSSMDKPPTSELEAYQELMACKELNRIRTQQSMIESLNRLDIALTIDPQFADALAEKAVTLHVMSALDYVSNYDSTLSESEYYALQAIKIDPFNSRAYATLGNLYFDAQKWEQSETAFQIAIQHNPNDALANYWYSLNLRYLGRLEEAIQYSSVAAELDPLYPVIQTGHALTCMMGNRMDLAKRIIDKGAVLFQNYFGYHWILGYYYMCIEDYPTAIETFNKSQELSPAIKSIQRQIMFCKGKMGEIEEVEAYIESQTGEDPETYINLASAYSGLGREEECIQYLKLLAESGNTSPSDIHNVKFREMINNGNNQELINQLNQMSVSVH